MLFVFVSAKWTLKRRRKRRKVCLPVAYLNYSVYILIYYCFSNDLHFLFTGKLPKNFDPKSTPDPERWLPIRERSYYRGRKKGKKKEQVGRGTQGATSGAATEL